MKASRDGDLRFHDFVDTPATYRNGIGRYCRCLNSPHDTQPFILERHKDIPSAIWFRIIDFSYFPPLFLFPDLLLSECKHFYFTLCIS